MPWRSKDGLFLNAELVKQGAARRYKVAPNVKYDAKFVELDTGLQNSTMGPVGMSLSVLAMARELAALKEERVLLLPSQDRRSQHITTVLKPGPGATIRIGVVGIGVGRVTVKVCDSGEVEISSKDLALTALAPTPHVELLLAMPRPKVMMRLWSVLAQLGLRRIVLTNAWRVEKSYFSSQSTEQRKYLPELLEGLEQAVCTTLPEVQIEMRLKPFIEDQVDLLFPSDRFLRLFCHPGHGMRIADAVAAARKGSSNPPKAVVLAVGPEGGWVDYEVGLFRQHGFIQVSLGRRILTTDVAIVSLASLTLDALFASEQGPPATTWKTGADLLSRLLPCCS
ncbi:unnamed protein product [Durusdinium trenchii]|uniref:16S rRNA (uracil(1498)-N(3))-methyltransferase n=1 Tax=Durusdinium trenchii TaxID=1381693 RepID=A0ABP0L858_9DINO